MGWMEYKTNHKKNLVEQLLCLGQQDVHLWIYQHTTHDVQKIKGGSTYHRNLNRPLTIINYLRFTQLKFDLKIREKLKKQSSNTMYNTVKSKMLKSVISTNLNILMKFNSNSIRIIHNLLMYNLLGWALTSRLSLNEKNSKNPDTKKVRSEAQQSGP